MQESQIMDNNLYTSNNLSLKNHIFWPIKLRTNHVKILMIDDNPKDIELVNHLLSIDSKINFSFSGYKNSAEAIKLLKNNRLFPDLIILDCIMPSINGSTALQNLKQSEKTCNIPIIIHSSIVSHDNMMKCKELGANAFFEKPMNIELFENFILGKVENDLPDNVVLETN